jgi:hypothetical protein
MIQGKKKYTIEEIKKRSPKSLLNIINRAKKFLKTDEVMKKVFQDFGVDISFLDLIPMRFGDIEVSATTSHGIITLNYKLLADGDFFKDYGYLIHEVSHYLQQCFKNKPTKGADEGEYLDNPDEQEGFQNQIEYISREFGDNQAEKYVEGLLDHHDIDSKKERKEKKDVLMSKV